MKNSIHNSAQNSNIKMKSLYKAISLLSFFDLKHETRGVSELADLSGMLKSSVHNILKTYEQCGIVKKHAGGAKYSLGPTVLKLAHSYSAHNTIESIMKPYVDDLANKAGETVYLAIPNNGQALYLLSGVPVSNFTFNSYGVRGVSAQLHCTGIGKAMLAEMKSGEIGKILDEGLMSYTPNTIVDKDTMYEELERIRAQGFSHDNMEHEYGIRCVGISLKNSKNELVGGLSISGPSLRITDEKITEFVQYLQQIKEQVRTKL